MPCASINSNFSYRTIDTQVTSNAFNSIVPAAAEEVPSKEFSLEAIPSTKLNGVGGIKIVRNTSTVAVVDGGYSVWSLCLLCIYELTGNCVLSHYTWIQPLKWFSLISAFQIQFERQFLKQTSSKSHRSILALSILTAFDMFLTDSCTK